MDNHNIKRSDITFRPGLNILAREYCQSHFLLFLCAVFDFSNGTLVRALHARAGT